MGVVMRYSKLLGKSLRSVPQGVKSRAYSLLIQGGFVRPLGHGLYSLLPLGNRVIRKLKRIIAEEMESLGGQEVEVPVVNPYELWKKSGRSDLVDRDLIRFQDRTGRELVLSPSSEEAMVELVRESLNSYRDLPVFLYQFQTKFRDEEKVRSGLLRSKEFVMKDGYSFHRSYSDLNNFFPKVFGAYKRIFDRCFIEVITAEAGVGYMGGERSYEFLMPSNAGDDLVITCAQCGYHANGEVALGRKETSSETPLPLKKIHTPGCDSMAKLAAFLDLPRSKLAKPMVFRSREGFVMAVVRGDYEVSIEKLNRIVKAPIVRRATRAELEMHGLIPGYLSPLGVPSDETVVIDDSIMKSDNLVMAANEYEYHYKNVNFGRDFESELLGDIVRVTSGNNCYQCGYPLEETRAVELGNIFKLGDYYSRSMELHFQDEKDKKVYPYMGSYGIGLGRLLWALVEKNQDKRGIVWPKHLAPFDVFLMGIGLSPSVIRTVEELFREIPAEVLYDDRGDSPGVKFKDADLLGIPLRILVSSKHLRNGEVEFFDRQTRNTWMVPIEQVNHKVLDFFGA